jgi:hypothetical protein
MQIAEARPPYVTFEVCAVEDRNASIEAGHYIAKDVDFAFITPQGSKDRIELVVSEWFATLETEVRTGRFPAAWFEGFKESYRRWKSGQEIPENGYPVANWSILSPAQTRLFLDRGIRTVEDVAAMNEEAIQAIGMGGRMFKQRAIDWLASSKNIGKTSEELSALRIENADLKTSLEAIRKEFEVLKTSITPKSK